VLQEPLKTERALGNQKGGAVHSHSQTKNSTYSYDENRTSMDNSLIRAKTQLSLWITYQQHQFVHTSLVVSLLGYFRHQLTSWILQPPAFGKQKVILGTSLCFFTMCFIISFFSGGHRISQFCKSPAIL
jgi:hypothetical protein